MMALSITVKIKLIVMGFLVASLTGTEAVASPSAANFFAPTPKKIERPETQNFTISVQQTAHETAVRFVEFAGIDKNLSLLLLNDVKTSKEVTSAIEEVGFEVVKAKVVNAIKHAQLSHKPAWIEMLASVYENYFDGAELHSILTERESSPFFAKMVQLQSAISKDVNQQGSHIYKEAREQVLTILKQEFPA